MEARVGTSRIDADSHLQSVTFSSLPRSPLGVDPPKRRGRPRKSKPSDAKYTLSTSDYTHGDKKRRMREVEKPFEFNLKSKPTGFPASLFEEICQVHQITPQSDLMQQDGNPVVPSS